MHRYGVYVCEQARQIKRDTLLGLATDCFVDDQPDYVDHYPTRKGDKVIYTDTSREPGDARAYGQVARAELIPG